MNSTIKMIEQIIFVWQQVKNDVVIRPWISTTYALRIIDEGD
jgi:hypothetical protein